jgi:hypothetical protein
LDSANIASADSAPIVPRTPEIRWHAKTCMKNKSVPWKRFFSGIFYKPKGSGQIMHGTQSSTEALEYCSQHSALLNSSGWVRKLLSIC